MPSEKRYKVFRYHNNVRWKSGRRGTISSPGKHDIDVSSPPEFRGESTLWSTEELFIAAVNVCLMQTFMEFALRTDLGLVSYESSVEGVIERAEGRYRFTDFQLNPVVVVKTQQDVERAHQILDAAQAMCLISNSIRATVRMTPDIRAQAPETAAAGKD